MSRSKRPRVPAAFALRRGRRRSRRACHRMRSRDGRGRQSRSGCDCLPYPRREKPSVCRLRGRCPHKCGFLRKESPAMRASMLFGNPCHEDRAGKRICGVCLKNILRVGKYNHSPHAAKARTQIHYFHSEDGAGWVESSVARVSERRTPEPVVLYSRWP